jgi:ABC-type polar amino acid transport system ATPase subunit
MDSSTPRDPSGAPVILPSPPGVTGADVAIHVRDVTKAYGQQQVLRGVDLEVAAGEVIAIVGPSGSGKSTFIRCLNGLESRDGGEIVVAGRAVPRQPARAKRAELRDLRRKVGMVFQSFNLFPTMTALENVTLAQVHSLGRTREEADARSAALLDAVGLAHRMKHRPAELSGGQQQRVAIARALALDPEVMLFDEPTSAIDPELRVEVLKVMKQLAGNGMTMLVVTHELTFAEHVADRVVFFADGVIAEQGPPKQLFEHPRHPRLQQFLRAIKEEAI